MSIPICEIMLCITSQGKKWKGGVVARPWLENSYHKMVLILKTCLWSSAKFRLWQASVDTLYYARLGVLQARLLPFHFSVKRFVNHSGAHFTHTTYSVITRWQKKIKITLLQKFVTFFFIMNSQSQGSTYQSSWSCLKLDSPASDPFPIYLGFCGSPSITLYTIWIHCQFVKNNDTELLLLARNINYNVYVRRITNGGMQDLGQLSRDNA